MQVRLISYCPKHCTAHPELAGVQLVKEGEEEDRGDDGNGLWNCQPFKQPLSVPAPDCPAGSSRAQPLQVWSCISWTVVEPIPISCCHCLAPLLQPAMLSSGKDTKCRLTIAL